MKETKNYLSLAICLILIVCISSCSLDNSMYNARKYFNSAIARPLNQNGKPTQQAIDDYTKTIKKCGFILTERKDSSEADDALFLLASALYYKGNSQFQAKDQFESLIRNFPDSPYIHDATLFIAKIYRQINKPNEADIILEGYIHRTDNIKWHPAALLLLADFSIQDKNYSKAQFWLNEVLSNYPRTIQSKEASFLLGKNYFEQKDYTNSLNQFEKIAGVRGISADVKLDSRYNIALNLLMLNKYKDSYAIVNKLLKDEERPEKIPQVLLLKARILLAQKNIEESEELFQTIIKNYPRTPVSAEAYYWLAEYDYYVKGNIATATDKYGKSKAESAVSVYYMEATQKNAALKQIEETSKLNATKNSQLYIDSKLASAEIYFNVLNLPDSSFVIFNEIHDIPISLQTRIDSLSLKKLYTKERIDSLVVKVDSLISDSPLVQDSLGIALSDSTKHMADSLSTPQKYSNVTDNVDSLNVKNAITQKDSLQTTNSDQQKETILNKEQYDLLKLDMAQIDLLDTKLNELQTLFNTEYIPYSMFFEATMVSKDSTSSALVRSIYTEMTIKYPNNKYTNALKLMLERKSIRLIDPEQEKEEIILDKALSDINTEQDSAVVSLNKLAQSTYNEIKVKAKFRLGWYYTFEQPDTTRAKEYFNDVISADRASDYSRFITRFYNGNQFAFSTDKQDSLVTSQIPDTLSQKTTLDSLNSKSQIDSLNNTDLDKIKEKLKIDLENSNPSDKSNSSQQDFPLKKTDEPVLIPQEQK